MSKPPKYVLQQLKLPLSGWLQPEQGIGAQTWLSDKAVLQLRPIKTAERMLMVYQVSQTIQIPGLEFMQAPLVEHCDKKLYPIEKDHQGYRVWILQPRRQGAEPLFFKGIHQQQLFKSSGLAAKQIIAYLQQLQEQVHPRQVFCQYSTRGLTMQKADPLMLRGLADNADTDGTNPIDWLPAAEPQSQLVVSHGDSILKNTLAIKNKAYLIDWETIDLLPRHMDLAHWTVFTCKRSDYSQWAKIVKRDWGIFKDLLPDWSLDEWRLAVGWYMMRETLAFRQTTPKSRKKDWNNIRLFCQSV